MLQWTLKATPAEKRRNTLKRIIYLFVFSLLILFIDPVESKWLIYFLVFFVSIGSIVYAHLSYGTKYLLCDDGIVINDLSNRKSSKFYSWESLKTFQIVTTENQISQVADKSDFEGMEGKLVVFFINFKYDKSKRGKQLVLKAPQEIEKNIIHILEKYLLSYHYLGKSEK